MTYDHYMNRCLELAAKGMGKVTPNPLVGCVIVHQNTIIGEGFHEFYGGPHAEVNAVNSVKDKTLFETSTLYVNLEPCSHHGKTPPCADLIIEKKIKKVVIATQDPFPEVAGNGIEKLRSAGIEVVTGILEKESRELNPYFFYFYEHSKPYVILKWAQSADGLMAPANQENKNPLKISNSEAQKLVHQWRSEVQAILVGKETVLKDDPQLNVRLVKGKDPVPFILGSASDIPKDYQIWRSNPVFFDRKDQTISDILNYCLQHKIMSVLVEGGAKTLQYFMDRNFWNEARILTNINMQIGAGIKAPEMNIVPFKESVIGDINQVRYILNPLFYD